jgi:hypothetical protein
MSEQYVLIAELARFCKCDKSSIALRAEKLGIEIGRIRHPKSGHMCRAIKRDEASAVKASFKCDYEIVRPEDVA